jgi:hypothetical protein
MIHLAFYDSLKALLFLHQEVVTLPPNQTPDEIERNDKHYGRTSQTVLGRWMEATSRPGFHRGSKRVGGTAKTSFCRMCWLRVMDFVCILPGWEGSAHDGRVLGDAKAKGCFDAPPGKYYLADSGYSNASLTLTPYPKVRYYSTRTSGHRMQRSSLTYVMHPFEMLSSAHLGFSRAAS